MPMPWLATQGLPFGPVLFVLAFVWLTAGIGRRILILLGAWRGSREGSPEERGVLSCALGAGALQFVPFVLGAAGKLGTRSLQAAVLVVTLVAIPDLLAVARGILRALRARRAVNPPRTPDGGRAVWLAWLLALSPAIVAAGLMALVPTIDPDGLGYHLTVPKRWLQEGHLGYLATYPYSNTPMGTEMLFAIAMAFAGDIAAKCVHFALGTLGAVGLYLAGRRLGGANTGAVAAALFLVGPAGVCVVLGCAYVEGAASFAMIASALAWILWYQSREGGFLRCAALLAGLAVTFKISSALFPVAMFALTFVAVASPGKDTASLFQRLSQGMSACLRLLPLVVAPLLPWMTRSASVTGNPVFPLFARWIPSRDFSPGLSAKFDRFNRYMTWGNSFGRDWNIETRTHVLLGLCAALAVIGTLIALRMRSWITRGTAFVVLGTLLAQLLAAGLYIRYSTPIGSVLALPILAGLRPILSRKWVSAVLAAATLAASLGQAHRCLGSNAREIVAAAFGAESHEAFLRDELALFPLYEEANRDLPPDAGVLLSCYCAGFYLDRKTYCAEIVQESLRYSSWDDFTSDLRKLHITHVIAPSALANGGPPPPVDRSSVSALMRDDQVRFVRRLLTEQGHLRGTSADQSLYELEGSSAAGH